MLPLQSKSSRRTLTLAAAIGASIGALVGVAQADDVGLDVTGSKKGLYPIAVPTAPDGDAAVDREIASVASFDLGVAGVFKTLDPQSFLADLKTEGLGIEPQKWKDVGAYGVMKYKVDG